MNASATLKTSLDLLDAARNHALSLGYPSFNSYLTSLIRLDIMKPADHALGQRIASLPGIKRDRIDAKLCAAMDEAAATWQVVERDAEDHVAAMLSARASEGGQTPPTSPPIPFPEATTPGRRTRKA